MSTCNLEKKLNGKMHLNHYLNHYAAVMTYNTEGHNDGAGLNYSRVCTAEKISHEGGGVAL